MFSKGREEKKSKNRLNGDMSAFRGNWLCVEENLIQFNSNAIAVVAVGILLGHSSSRDRHGKSYRLGIYDRTE